MEIDKNFLSVLQCPICFEYANTPAECELCHHIFCQKCLDNHFQKKEDSICPICNTVSQFKLSELAKRLIGSMEIICPFQCKKSISRTDIDSHMMTCDCRIYECNICEYLAQEKEFIQHLLEIHSQELLSKFSKEIDKDKVFELAKTFFSQSPQASPKIEGLITMTTSKQVVPFYNVNGLGNSSQMLSRSNNNFIRPEEEELYNFFYKMIEKYNAAYSDEKKQKDFHSKIQILLNKIDNHEITQNLLYKLINFAKGK